MTDLVLYFDGACEPVNPGGVASYGWLLNTGAFGHGVIREGKGATNNLAEWCALGKGLRYIRDTMSGVGTLEIKGDSKLVIEQLTGNWQCKAENLIPLRARCLQLLAEIGCQWSATWVPREQNEKADALTRTAYEEKTGKKFPERRRKSRA